ncbi:uncharacterized protein N0V89_005837 [Didymosphaeria variabile]|uniref:Uncharacterized protein n=1 Tax=Didymosphaeria variabile TaxID=1932322 RepID=A0A9W8XMF3_9PLEO|nr:uncharacterized protein N0V89_005837 [Didymosphaeria variabile]KAJ4354104.1 hypothetical protein N0V89_005837 [Didymosphaeria variabile]
MQGYVQYDCKGFRTGGDSHDTPGLQDYCYAGPGLPQAWRSGRYLFRSDAHEASTTPATNCSLVDTLILGNGTKYALHGLDEDAISQAIETVVNGTVEAAIEKFNLSQL